MKNKQKKKRSRSFVGWIGLFLIVATAACRSSYVPDLGGLYNQVARYHDANRNPVVVIPGILGSRLVDEESGRIVWGAFGGEAANPRKPDGARLVALPLDPTQSLVELRDGVVPDGVLDKVKLRLAGLPLQLKAYFQILMALGAGGYRDEAFASIDYGDDHFTCFQFDYDWRRDNVENAARLHRFLLEKQAYVASEIEDRFGVENPEVKFDVIAHSMGGLVLRYFLRYGDTGLPADGSLPELTWAGSELVDKAVMIATPNAGAVEALEQLVHGRKFAPFTPRYEPAIIGTFPALYQLLPRVRHRPLVEGGEPVDFLDVSLWEERQWGLASPNQDEVLQMLLPGVDDPSERRQIAVAYLEKNLARARRFHAALDRPASPPEGTRLYLMAGDAHPTPATASWSGKNLSIASHGPGDGTVLRSSALMDERLTGEWQPRLVTPIDWWHSTFLFADHLGLTRDPTFTDNLLYLLLEAPSRDPIEPHL